MKRTLEGWVVRGAPVAPVATPVQLAEAAVDGTERLLDAGATHVSVDVGPNGTHVVADKKPAPKKTRTAKRSRESRGIRFNKTIASRTAVPRPAHTLLFSDFVDVAVAATGDAAFEYTKRGTPLAGKSGTLRGAIAEAVVKRVLTEMGCDVRDADASNCVNGRARGQGRERYDMLVDDAKVETKNARMTYNPLHQAWSLHFTKVKTSEFDRLILCFEGFDGLRLYEWGGNGYTTNGKSEAARGGDVAVIASRSQPDALAAHTQLIAKMEEKGNTLLKFVPYADSEYADVWEMKTRTDRYYEGVPLAALSSKARGGALEAIVRAFVSTHLGRAVADAPVTQTVAGGSRGKHATTCDFLVDGERAEVKSAMMNWHKYHECFKLHFQNVKPEEHDALYLAWMTPRGVHIFEHDGRAGLSTHGKETEATGYTIQFTAPCGKTGYTVPAAAERFLLKNLHWHKLPYLGFLAFQDGDAERVMERGAVLASAGVDEEGEEEEDDEEDESD